MAQFPAGAKNPPWVRSNDLAPSIGQLTQPPPPLAATLLAATSLGGTAGTINPTQSLAHAVLQQAHQQSSQPQTYGLTTLSLAQSGVGLSQQMTLPPPSSMPPGMSLSTTLTTAPIATISYPTPRMMQQATPPQPSPLPAGATGPSKQQRVFTGTITTLHKNFGFVDEDVFFQTSCIQGATPNVGDRVLVEATYNASMPFKWNGSRVQVIPSMLSSGASDAVTDAQATLVRSLMSHPPPSLLPTQPIMTPTIQTPGTRTVTSTSIKALPTTYNNVPPPPGIRNTSLPTLDSSFVMSTSRHTSAAAPPAPFQRDRQREREDARRDRERERRSRGDQDKTKNTPPPPSQKRSRSPRPRTARSPSPPRKKSRPTPRYNVQVPKISLDLLEANVMEVRKRYTSLYVPSDFFASTVTWHEAFSMGRPFQLDTPCNFHVMHKDINSLSDNDAVLEPADVDHVFSAKVMLLASPPQSELHRRSCRLAEDPIDVQDECIHPARVISFLVGLRGKNETMAIGGPWSPSLDGPDPDKDPKVLINTAIRTCKALTGIDLSPCTKWYRFLEVHYRRNRASTGSSTAGGVKARIETVVLFFPDVWSCVPTDGEWAGQVMAYKLKLHQLQEASGSTISEDVEDMEEEEEKKNPTHYSELDPKQMKISDLRRELEARNLSPKGLKTQLIARLNKAIKTESEMDDEEETETSPEPPEKKPTEEDKLKLEEEKLKKLEKDKELLVQRYNLPESPAIIVHPSSTAKSGNFDCTVMSLSLLLDYRPEDNKEHSFEVSLFAELFNEMLMRDFGFRIYHSLVTAPEKEQDSEKEKKKGKSDDDKKDSKERKKEKSEDVKKDSKEDDKKDKKKSSEKTSGDSENGDDKEKPVVQLCTHDPGLLLACAYFDLSHCGYIMERDVEEIFYTLGLSLSRAQVKKLLQKVIVREKLHYRTLTDGPADQCEAGSRSESKQAQVAQLASGNSGLLPVFKLGATETPTITPTSTPTKGRGSKRGKAETKDSPVNVDMIMHRGALVDVNKLLKQLERSEKARNYTDKTIKELQEKLDKLTKSTTSQDQDHRNLNLELQDTQKSLKETQEFLQEAQGSSMLYKTSLEECQTLILNVVEKAKSTTKEVKKEKK